MIIVIKKIVKYSLTNQTNIRTQEITNKYEFPVKNYKLASFEPGQNLSDEKSMVMHANNSTIFHVNGTCQISIHPALMEACIHLERIFMQTHCKPQILKIMSMDIGQTCEI